MKIRAWTVRLTILVLSAVVGFLFVEAWFRVAPPKPAGQIVREKNIHLHNGVPVWGNEARWEFKCVHDHPERRRVMFFGNSIVYGVGVADNEPFAHQLEDRLNADDPKPGFCVMNFAQPGFGFLQNAAWANDMIPRYSPDLVVWLSWNDEESDYVMLGSSAYRIPSWSLGPDKLPDTPLVPRPLNRFLFFHSRFYEYMSILWATRVSQPTQEQMRGMGTRVAGRLRKMIALVRSHGGRLMVLQTPALDQPFGTTDRFISGIVREAWDEQVRVVFLGDLLVDQDVMALRQDPCCHFNVAGHKEVARVLEPIVLDEIKRAKPRAAEAPMH